MIILKTIGNAWLFNIHENPIFNIQYTYHITNVLNFDLYRSQVALQIYASVRLRGNVHCAVGAALHHTVQGVLWVGGGVEGSVGGAGGRL